MLKILRNLTAEDVAIKDMGVVVPANGQYIIQPPDYPIWIFSRNTVEAIIAGAIMVNDGEDDLRNKRVAIAMIQDNQIVLNEHYTLVEEDDVLIGNGQILYLNDEFDTTDDVPDYIDEQIEDDDPTES